MKPHTGKTIIFQRPQLIIYMSDRNEPRTWKLSFGTCKAEINKIIIEELAKVISKSYTEGKSGLEIDPRSVILAILHDLVMP